MAEGINNCSTVYTDSSDTDETRDDFVGILKASCDLLSSTTFI